MANANDDNGSEWTKGIGLSVLASVIGAASKFAIRKSWLMENGIAESANAVTPARTAADDHPPLHDGSYEYGNSTMDGDVDSNDGARLASARRGQKHPSRKLSSTQVQCIAYALRLSGMIGMSFLNPACGVLAMQYASPSITAPFSGLTLVWIVWLSYPVLRERPSRKQVWATIWILVGEVVVALFGDHTNDEGLSEAGVKKSYQDPVFVAFLILLTLYMMLLFYWMGDATAIRSPAISRFAWGTAGGTITGLQNFLKDAWIVLRDQQEAAADGRHPSRSFFYFLLFMASVTAFGGLLILTACMKRYSATFSGAAFVGSFVISASIMSAIHYRTFRSLEAWYDYILYPIGLMLLVRGTGMLIQDDSEQHSSDSAKMVDGVSYYSEHIAACEDDKTRRQKPKYNSEADRQRAENGGQAPAPSLMGSYQHPEL